jgi:hypothetical protein
VRPSPSELPIDRLVPVTRPLVFVVVLLLAFALRVSALSTESFWRDEVDAILFAQAPWPALLSSFTLPQHNGLIPPQTAS